MNAQIITAGDRDAIRLVLVTRCGARLKDGDVVVIEQDPEMDAYLMADEGRIGVLRLDPGYQSIRVEMGCEHLRLNPGDVRPLKMGEKVRTV